MKKLRLLVLTCCFLGSVMSLAQGRRDRIEEMRMQYLSKHAGLSENEAEKFWPLYDEYHFKIRSNKKQLRQLYMRYSEQSGDEAVKQLRQAEQLNRKQELEIHTVYSEKIVALIGERKYMRLRGAEEGFRKELLRTIRDRTDQDD